MNLLIFGCSITWGAWDKKGGWAQRIKNFADRSTSRHNREAYSSFYKIDIFFEYPRTYQDNLQSEDILR